MSFSFDPEEGLSMWVFASCWKPKCDTISTLDASVVIVSLLKVSIGTQRMLNGICPPRPFSFLKPILSSFIHSHACTHTYIYIHACMTWIIYVWINSSYIWCNFYWIKNLKMQLLSYRFSILLTCMLNFMLIGHYLLVFHP